MRPREWHQRHGSGPSKGGSHVQQQETSISGSGGGGHEQRVARASKDSCQSGWLGPQQGRESSSSATPCSHGAGPLLRLVSGVPNGLRPQVGNYLRYELHIHFAKQTLWPCIPLLRRFPWLRACQEYENRSYVSAA